MTPAEVLLLAAEIIERDGHNKGSAFAYPRLRRTKGTTWEQLIDDAVTRGPVSIEGALERAIWGKVQRFETYRMDAQKLGELVETKNYLCGWLSWNRGISNPSLWNDDPDTTSELAVLLLRQAADAWEEPPF